jgi:hypothetical protein
MEGAREQEREEVDGLSTRAASWLEWTLCALSVALTVLGLWLLVLGLSRPNVPVYSYWAEGTLLAVGYSTVGAVVASPRPGKPVGWALCSIGLSWGTYHFSSEYVTYALLAAPGSLPAAKAAVWIASWLWVPGLGLIVFLALLFPSGQLPSPGARFGLSVQPLPLARRAQPHAGGGTGQGAQTPLAIPTGFRNTLPRL